jgi:hypothetical protein
VDLNDKPIHPKTIQECVKVWTTQHAQRIKSWAYDGRNNLYSTATIPDPHKVNKENYEEFTLTINTAGKKFPSHFKCAPAVTPNYMRTQQHDYLCSCLLL